MLNHLLSKQKETSRRFLNITVARVVAVSPQMRLVQDNPNSVRYINRLNMEVGGSYFIWAPCHVMCTAVLKMTTSLLNPLGSSPWLSR